MPISEKGVQAGAQAEHHVSLGDDFHGSLGAVVAQRAHGQRMGTGEGVVVLVVAADRGWAIKTFMTLPVFPSGILSSFLKN